MLVTKLIAAAATTMLLGSAAAIADSIEAAPTITAESDAEEADTIIYSVRLRMPYGNSVWTADLDRAWVANPVKLRFLVEPSCRAPRVGMSLRSSVNGAWVRTTQSGDLDVHTLAAFDGIRFEIQQPYLLEQVCEFRLYTAGGAAPAPDPVWGPGVLSGGAEFNGGFASNMEVNISAATRIRGFRIAIPEFCAGTEILEAGTVTEGNYDPATLIDAQKRLYQVVTGSVRASRIVFSLNGPFDSRCFVPVYTYVAE